MMTLKTRLIVFATLFLWASAFVGIRFGLQGYSPAGLALLRYLVASCCMGIVYWCLPNRTVRHWRDVTGLLGVGVVGVGFYNLMLNQGETTLPSGVASFIISQSPLVTTLLAVFFLKEGWSVFRLTGFLVSVIGVLLISLGSHDSFKWGIGFSFIFLATLASGLYSILQKPFLKKHSPIESAVFIIWGGTLFLLFYIPQLWRDFSHATGLATSVVIYMGIFPAAIGYIGWSYVLSVIPATRAASFLYFMPFIAALLGWACLGEVTPWISIIGGLVAIFGVWIVNQSYHQPVSDVLATEEIS